MAAKHHYLSRTYLQGFAHRGDRMLWVRREGGPPFRASPTNAAKRDGYYTVPRHWNARPPNEIEDSFGQIESAVGGFLRRAEVGDADFSMEERHALVAFAAIHHARVPASRRHQVAQHLRLVEMCTAVYPLSQPHPARRRLRA